MAGLCCSVNGNQPEGHGITFLPLKIVHKTPMEVAAYGKVITQTVLNTCESYFDKSNTPLTDDMFQCFRVELIVHLSKFSAVRSGECTLRAHQGAGIVLYAQKIIILDIGEIMGKFIIPLFFCMFLSAGCGLNIM